MEELAHKIKRLEELSKLGEELRLENEFIDRIKDSIKVIKEELKYRREEDVEKTLITEFKEAMKKKK